MANNHDLNDLYCAFGNEQHFYELPIQMSCSHFVCKECIPLGRELICKKCNRKNENDLRMVNDEASFRAKKLLSLRLGELCHVLSDTFKDKIKLLEGSKLI